MTYRLETERLIIRSTKKADADFCIGIWLDDEMGKYLTDPPKEKAGTIYEDWKNSVETYDGCHYFVAVLKATDEHIGSCSLVPSDDEKVWDLGYCVHKDFWRQGYGSEMLSELIHFCKLQGANIMTAPVAKENIASNRLVQKFGFTVVKESQCKKSRTDIYHDLFHYELKL